MITFLCLVWCSYALAGECPNELVRHESNVNSATGEPYSTELPGCRAFELVSSPEAGGWEAPAARLVAGQGRASIVTPAGSVFFESQATPLGSGAVEDGNFTRVFRSSRTRSGWVARELDPTSTPGNEYLWGASADGTRALINTTISLVPEDIDNPTNNTSETGQDLYRLQEGGPPLLVTHGEVPSPETPTNGAGVKTNADLSAVGFVSTTSLTRPQTPGNSTRGCYVWADDGSRLAVPTNPDEESANPSVQCRMLGVARNGWAIIEDTSGDTDSGLLFASPSSSGFPHNAIQLSGDTRSAAQFDALSSDGDVVFNTTTDKLTEQEEGETGEDVYAIDLAAAQRDSGPPVPPAVSCVSCEALGAGTPNSANASWVAQSTDGSHVFFELGNGDLYVRTPSGTQSVAGTTDGVSQLVISANGRHAIGLSSASLSPADTDNARDLYLFNEEEGWAPRLITSGTFSTDDYTPTAVSNSGTTVLYEDHPSSSPAVIQEWMNGTSGQISPLGATQNYSVMGTAGTELEDVFFEGHTPLVAQDLNAGTTDIYDARTDGGFPAPSEPANTAQTPNPIAPPISGYGPNLTPPSTEIASLPSDTSPPAGVSKPKPLTRRQKLAKALKICKKDEQKRKRVGCEKHASQKYAPARKTAKK